MAVAGHHPVLASGGLNARHVREGPRRGGARDSSGAQLHQSSDWYSAKPRRGPVSIRVRSLLLRRFLVHQGSHAWIICFVSQYDSGFAPIWCICVTWVYLRTPSEQCVIPPAKIAMDWELTALFCWTQVGPRVLLGWMRHYFALAAYTLLDALVRPLALRSRWFRLRRWADAWHWGSGHDYQPCATESRGTGHATAHDLAATPCSSGDWPTPCVLDQTMDVLPVPTL